jgi:hypothetical protein
MPNFLTPIASQVLAATAASVTFSAIPATFTDLMLKVSSRTNVAGNNDALQVQFNGNTATNYSMTRLTGTGSAASSLRASNATEARVGWTNGNTGTANTFGLMEIYIPNYAGSANKPFSSFGLSEQNATAANMDAIAALWRNVAAITSIYIVSNNAGLFQIGSRFDLYGILKA